MRSGATVTFREVDHRVAEVEDGRVGILEVDRQAQDLLVELFRREQVLDEQGDVTDGLETRLRRSSGTRRCRTRSWRTCPSAPMDKPGAGRR
jgi:hypothetical protein